MEMDNIRLKAINKLYKSFGGKRRKAAGIAGDAGEKGMELRLPVQTELEDIMFLYFCPSAVADCGLMACSIGHFVKLIYDFAGAAAFAQHIHVQNLHQINTFSRPSY